MRQLRQLLIFAFLTLLLVIGWSNLRSTGAALATDNYADRLFQSHLGDRPIPSAAVAQAPEIPITAESVAYGTIEGQPIMGYLARPSDAITPLPGLIVIHEWWGLNENIEMMTRRLAAEGYTALAVDLFGQVADTPEQAKAQVEAAAQNPEKLQQNLQQAYAFLNDRQQASKIGSIGWCFGGSWSLQTALLFPTDLDATVIYYGGQLATDPNVLEPLTMPILGLFGELDTNPSVETVRSFEAALNQLNKPVDVYIYPDANHAFANPSGTRYNAAAAEDAWQKTTAFLKQHLQ